MSKGSYLSSINKHLFKPFKEGSSTMNRSGSVGVVGRRGVGLKPYILLAAASIFTLLMSCGDNIIEGGKSGPRQRLEGND